MLNRPFLRACVYYIDFHVIQLISVDVFVTQNSTDILYLSGFEVDNHVRVFFVIVVVALEGKHSDMLSSSS